MSARTRFQALLLFLLTFLFASPLTAQQTCQPPALLPTSRAPNIFSEQQENDLGDALAEQVQREFRVIDDEEVAGHLQRIGGRILKHLPPSNIHYRFLLSDLPIANAFAIPGGRIFVTRKMIALARSEDELAGVIAHEIGHVVARQGAIHMTELFRRVLNVTQVTDRKDVFDKYHQFLDNVARRPSALGDAIREESREQLVADQVAFYAAARAGYDSAAFASLFDRMAETQGKTGSWLSDFFGATKPEQKRLREMLKLVSAVPEPCIERGGATRPEEFQAWQTSVAAYSGSGRREALRGVVARRVLDPPLRTDIGHFRFSLDGKHFLAQDDASIFVASREPLSLLFRIDAEEARPAHFTPDSESVVFYTAALRVESWNVADGKRTAIHEVYKRGGCLQTALSPDGKSLACFDPSFELSLLDVATGKPFFEKKEFYLPNIFLYFQILLAKLLGEDPPDILQMSFSSDGRYFAAARGYSVVAYDFTTRAAISLPGSVKNLMGGLFTFVGPDRIAGVDGSKGEKSAVVKFPGGEVITRLTLGGESLSPVAHGDFLLLRPIKDYPVGLMDLKTGKVNIANKKPAVDVHDDVYLSERTNGEVSLYRVSDSARLASLTLPRSPLGRLRAAAISHDLKWLAVSERNRGAVWNLRTGQRVFFVRGFRGAEFFGDQMYGDFPKFEKTPRSLAILDMPSRNTFVSQNLEDQRVDQYGPYLLLTVPAKKNESLRENVTLEVKEARNANVLWSRHFPKERPDSFVSPGGGSIVFSWMTASGAAKQAAKGDPTLQARLAAMKEKEGDYYLEVADLRTGATHGKLLVETGKGSFRISDVTVAGDRVILEDTGNRVLVYSLASGEQKGRFFGRRAILSAAAGLLCFENEPGQLSFHDLDTLEKRGEISFSNRVSYLGFSDDGKSFFALTRNQTAYILDVAAIVEPGAQRATGP